MATWRPFIGDEWAELIDGAIGPAVAADTVVAAGPMDIYEKKSVKLYFSKRFIIFLYVRITICFS